MDDKIKADLGEGYLPPDDFYKDLGATPHVKRVVQRHNDHLITGPDVVVSENLKESLRKYPESQMYKPTQRQVRPDWVKDAMAKIKRK